VDVGYTLHSLGKKPIMGIQSWDGFTCLKRPFVVLGEEGDIGYTDGDGKRASISIPDFAKVIPGLARKVMGDIGLLNGDKSISLEEASSYVFKGLEELEMTYTLEGKKRFHEIYAGITADVLLSPALYFGYDFTQKKSNIDGTIYHTFDLSSCGVSGLVLGLGGKVGYTRVKKPYGIAHDTRVFLFKPENIDWRAGTVAFEPDGGNLLFDKTCWFYAGANADVIYSLNENVKARAGIAFSYNNADEGSWINEKNHKKHNVWFSSGIEFTF
jgi:hypothetical protein